MKSQQSSASTQGSGVGGLPHHNQIQQQQQQRQGATAISSHQAASSTKKASSSFFEKHAFSVSQSNIVNKLQVAVSSSSYNMHRQNATRGDSNQAHMAASASSSNNISNLSQPQHQQQPQPSRDKPSSKKFSQNMLSKSQHFGTLQTNQAMLSQQTYLAQGIPQMQQQNFIGQGLVAATANASLNSSASHLNTSAHQHYDANIIESVSNELGGAKTGSISPSKRHMSKTSLGKRKHMLTGPQHGVPHSQPTDRTDGSVSNNAGILPSSQTSLAQKRYSVNSLVNTAPTAQGTVNSNGQVSVGMSAALSLQHSQPQVAKQTLIMKSESNNKLRRISNMKLKQGAPLTTSDTNAYNCDQRNVSIAQSQMHTAANNSPGLMHQQFSQQSQNFAGLNFLQQNATAQLPATGMKNGAQKSSTSSMAVPGSTPANISNLTSFGQSHSERTSITDEAHTSGLIKMQWTNNTNINQHAQCSTQRHKNNEQKNHFIQQLHSSKETFGTTSQINGPNHGGIFSNKQTKDKMFFVTDHKLQDDQQFAAQDEIQHDAATNNSSILRQKAPSYHQHHHGKLQQQQQQHHQKDEIQVNSQQQVQQPMSQGKQHSLYLSNKACKKNNQPLTSVNSSSILQSTASLDSQHQQPPKQRGAAVVPVHTKHNNASIKQQQNNSIVCPIYQSKDIRLMKGQQVPQTTKHQNNAGQQPPPFTSVTNMLSNKTDQKDVKREGRRDSKNGSSAARRSMSDDMHEDVYMAKTEHQKPRKRAFKTNSVIETTSNQNFSHKNSNNSSETYERSNYQQQQQQQQMKKNATQQGFLKPNSMFNSSKMSWPQHQEELYHPTSNPQPTIQSQQLQQQKQLYISETSSVKNGTANDSINQERRDVEPLADKLHFLTNQACQSKVKSKSQLTQSMKNSGALRKGIKSPQGSQSTLQEPSAKAMPTSSKVKISQKFNKFEQSNPAMGKMGLGYNSKQNLFQTKTLKKQGSGSLQDFKEGSFKSPDGRHLQMMKKTGSISYAILPRQVIPHSELKAQKKMKSPSPSIKLQGQPDQMHRMRSPQNIKAQNNSSSQRKQNQGAIIENLAQTNVKSMSNSLQNQQPSVNFQARRLSQQRGSLIVGASKPPQANNKSNLIETTAAGNQTMQMGKQPQTVKNSISGTKRMSFSELNSARKVLNNDGADEAKKLYCMIDSRKSSQSSLHNAPNIASNLNQVQIFQVDSQGNAKTNVISKVQAKTKDKVHNYAKPAGFLSQSPKAKKPVKGINNKFYESSLILSQGSGNQNISQSKLSNKQHKYVPHMQTSHSQVNHHVHRELLKNHASVVGSIATAHKALLQIQAPKVVHLQSPPSRILVKVSPRISPNPKIRHHKGTTAGVQTCKVSIDTLQKGTNHQKVNRAHSKEFLKTIKLMKRGSNSPLPSPSPNLHYMKSSQGSPANISSLHNQLNSQQSNSAARGVLKQSALHHEGVSQLKNYNSSSQNQKSALARQGSQNSSKLFSRLQMRKAKEAQLQGGDASANDVAGDQNQPASFSERYSNNGSFLGQASQSMIMQNSSSGYPIQQANLIKQQYSQSLLEKNETVIEASSNMRDRANIHAKQQRLHNQGAVMAQDSNNPKNQSAHGKSIIENISMGSDLSNPAQMDQQVASTSTKRHQVPTLPLQPSGIPPQCTPSKRVKTQQVVPVLARHLEAEDEEVKNVADIQSKMIENERQGKKTVISNAPPATIDSQKFSSDIKQVVRPASKQASGVLTSMSNEEQKEQAAFMKDLEKLKRMFKLHFQNYNTAPPTTNEFYRIGRVLGKGAFGKVSLAMHKVSEQLVAIKSMSRETLRDEVDQRRRTKLEMGILQQCNHPNVVRLFDTFETTKHICFVIELCSGGDLFLYIKKRRRLKEDVARFFFKQLIEGLAYIHNAKKVVHRDIKLENILLDATGNVKICDFGVSRQLQTGRERMKEQCGTPAYIAPEILLDEGYTGFKVDMWSAGVCLYAMLIGSVPFKASTMSQLQALIVKGDYDFKFQTNANSKNIQNPKAATTLLSEEVQDLISKLLQTDPNKRLSAVDTLHHPWLQSTKEDLDVYTDKEKQLIQKEYMRLNLKLSQQNRLQSGVRTTGSRLMSTQSHQHMQQQETEQQLFTEHNLETRVGEEEPNLQNQEEKSFILAPFNSVKSMFIDQSNQIKEIKKDDPPYKWPREVMELITPRRIIKFSQKCREKNRIYEQNNNADLDNGVYNEFVNEQEREEGALMKQAQQDAEDDADADGDTPHQEREGQQERRQMVSQEEEAGGAGFLDDDDVYYSHSEDSLERSFKETELASDDEEAEQQVAEQRRLLSHKKQNEEAISLLRDSTNSSNDLILDTDEHEPGQGATPAREQMHSPLAGALGKHMKATKGHQQPKQPGTLSKQSSRPQLRAGAAIATPLKQKVQVKEYVEPTFVLDYEVINRIQKANVIPRWYLLQELMALQPSDPSTNATPIVATRDKSMRINYVTATYFLLLKRRELEELQRRQESRLEEEPVHGSIEKSN